MLGPVQLETAGHLEPQRPGEEPPRALQVRDRERHRARCDAQPGPGTLAGLGAAWVVLHQLDQHSVGVPHAGSPSPGLAHRIAQGRRAGGRGALQAASKSATQKETVV